MQNKDSSKELSLPIKAMPKKELIKKAKEIASSEIALTSPLALYAQLKMINDASKEALTSLKPVINQADITGELDEVEGFTITRQAQENWDYSHCARWSSFKTRINMYQEFLKSHEALMRKAAEFHPNVMYDDVGEVIEPAKRKDPTIKIVSKY